MSLVFMLLMTRSAYAQQGYTPDSLFIVLYSVGDALIEYDIKTDDPLADSISVNIFGNPTTDPIVTDLEDKFIASRTGASPNELLITPAGATDIRISYSTSDLVSKSGREWTFAIDSPVSFSVKMPQDSIAIQFGNDVPDQLQIGSQTLLTFPAGNQTVTYIVGLLGTDVSATIAIKAAETSIDQEKKDNPGIILAGAEELLARAKEAYEAEKFIDAERFARQANENVETTVEDYADAIAARNDARSKIQAAESQGRDVSGANALFAQSTQQFEAGDYANATNSAEDAVRAIGGVQQNIWPYGLGAAVAGGVAGAFYVMKRRQGPRQQAALVDPDPATASEPIHWPQPPPPAPSPPSVPAQEPAAKLSGIPESQLDKELLSGIVHRIIEERPHLRQEDRDVLVFLAQSEGAAFESEVRSKFQLPKTTVWRLVKRLEREELVEIRKAGGQNLIKLRFEGRQP
ncbi:MAG: hypothetical protein QXJ74_00975 [Nitrososphaera sp.]|uniref:helix-turn-helix transcriptional regulator n=1 Tax=Nitrososphaera sp. TaxID=1971748 RepID=UPI0017DD4151|nr:hypothetical protein [Nitrososphaera sp.]NWG37453.1 hypothetical protein [Nitrososphaera sp.]